MREKWDRNTLISDVFWTWQYTYQITMRKRKKKQEFNCKQQSERTETRKLVFETRESLNLVGVEYSSADCKS